MTCPCPQKPSPIRFSAVVLAGGRSRRMGRDKAWLPCEGRPLIERQVALLRSLKPDAVYVSGRSGSDYSSLSCPVLVDRFRDCGPLGGIEAAFASMPSRLLLVLAADMPGMTANCPGAPQEEVGFGRIVDPTERVPELNAMVVTDASV